MFNREKDTFSLCIKLECRKEASSPFVGDKYDMVLGLLENLLLHALLFLWQVVITGELANAAHETLKDLLVEDHLNFAAESSYCLHKM